MEVVMKIKSESEKIAVMRKIAVINIVINIALALSKLAAGIVGNSAALVSDAVHSASDVMTIIIVAVGLKMATKDADTEHEYGHERIECLAAIILAAILFATGLTIGMNGIKTAFSAAVASEPGVIALAAAGLSIVVKELMFRYTKAAAVKIDSSALLADAWHSRSDALSSVGSLAGVVAARNGFAKADALAAVIIAALILKVAVDIFMDAAKKLTDTSCGQELENEMCGTAMETDGVLKIDSIRTRRFGSKIYVDMELSANGALSLTEAHEIAENVHNMIEQRFEGVKHCTVHMNPLYEEQK